ncbi:MAG: hypothetical protein Q9217_003118 [Psora testacea]
MTRHGGRICTRDGHSALPNTDLILLHLDPPCPTKTMYLQLVFLLAPLTILTPTIALPQATQDAGPATTSSSEPQDTTSVATTALGAEVHCVDERDAAPISDCSKAMMEFPQNLDTHLFHSGGDPDIYRLPSQRMVGQCLMSIELESDQPELSSWLAIGTIALQLTMACANQRLQFGFGLTGGYTYTGHHRRIRVVLTKVKKANQDEKLSIGGNNTLGVQGAFGQNVKMVPAEVSTS